MKSYTLYRFWAADGALLYVGITADPLARWSQHRDQKPWWREVVSITVAHFDRSEDAEAAEVVAISSEGPRYNGAWVPKARRCRPEAAGHSVATSGVVRYGDIAARIRERILAGEWRPGDRLPGVSHLATEYGASRNTISRAIGVLELEGFVWAVQGRGITLRLDAPIPVPEPRLVAT